MLAQNFSDSFSLLNIIQEKLLLFLFFRCANNRFLAILYCVESVAAVMHQ